MAFWFSDVCSYLSVFLVKNLLKSKSLLTICWLWTLCVVSLIGTFGIIKLTWSCSEMSQPGGKKGGGKGPPKEKVEETKDQNNKGK